MMSFAVLKRLLAVTAVVSALGTSWARAEDVGAGWFYAGTNVLLSKRTLLPLPHTNRVTFANGKQVKSLADEQRLIAQHVPMCTLELGDIPSLEADTFIFLPHDSTDELPISKTEDHHVIYSAEELPSLVNSLKCVYVPNRSLYVSDINKILGPALMFLDSPQTELYLKIRAEEAQKDASSQSTRDESGRADESVLVESSSKSSAGSARN